MVFLPPLFRQLCLPQHLKTLLLAFLRHLLQALPLAALCRASLKSVSTAPVLLAVPSLVVLSPLLPPAALSFLALEFSHLS